MARFNHRRLVALYSVLAVAVFGILSMYLFLVYAKTPQARSRQNQGLPILGTWIGEKGNVLDIRSDGTARWRSAINEPHVGYFEWTIDSNEFKVFQYSGKHNLGWFIKRALLNDTPTDRYQIVTVTPTELKIRTDKGDVTTFVSTKDDELEAAP